MAGVGLALGYDLGFVTWIPTVTVNAPVTAPKGPPGCWMAVKCRWDRTAADNQSSLGRPQQEQLPMMLGLACRADLIGCNGG